MTEPAEVTEETVAPELVTPPDYVLGWDASNPPDGKPAGAPEATVFGFYIGGDTPHVWTKEQVNNAQPAYGLPYFVRSNPPTSNAASQAQTDAMAAAEALSEFGIPEGYAIVLDLETAVAPDYVEAFAKYLPNYKVGVYGSEDFVFGNAHVASFVIAANDGAKSPVKGAAGTQFSFDGQYDLDWFEKAWVDANVWKRGDHDPLPGLGHEPQEADGTKSLAQWASDRGADYNNLVNRTRQALADDPGKLAAFNGYLEGRMPKGLVFYSENK
jgi:Domain of unknown function (DUF1906)